MAGARQTTDNRSGWRRMGHAWWIVAVLAIGASSAATADPATADTDFVDRFVQQVVKGTRFSGRVGLYDLRRYHNFNQPFQGNPTQDPDANYNLYGTAIDGNFVAQTGMLYGVSAGLGVSLSESLIDYDHPNPNLLGENGDHLRTITQGYLQYNYPGLRLRGGRQLLKTPFATGDQFAFLPFAFNGVSMAIHPLALDQHLHGDGRDAGTTQAASGSDRFVPPSYQNDLTMDFSFGAEPQATPSWSLYLARIYRFELRTRDDFQTGNRYVNNTSGFLTAGTQFATVRTRATSLRATGTTISTIRCARNSSKPVIRRRHFCPTCSGTSSHSSASSIHTATTAVPTGSGRSTPMYSRASWVFSSRKSRWRWSAITRRPIAGRSVVAPWPTLVPI